MTILWLIILLIALATGHPFPMWAWFLLIPFLAQDTYDINRKRSLF